MQKVLLAEEMREIDRLTTERYGIPSLLLMESAAQGAARVIAERLEGDVSGKSFLILCGKGNNGGDGAALARILATQGALVDLVLFGRVEESKGDAEVNFQICAKLAAIEAEIIATQDPEIYRVSDVFIGGGALRWLEAGSPDTFGRMFDEFYAQDWDVIVDALFGTGLARPVEGAWRDVIRRLNIFQRVQKKHFRAGPLVVAIDIPSGLAADRSQIAGECVEADLTVTFTAPKPANVLPPASNADGELVVVNIGSPRQLIDEAPSQLLLTEKGDVKTWLGKTNFAPASYKNKRGHALLVAGSNKYAGAAVLAGNAAIVSGVGLATIATSHSAQNSIASRVLPEVMTRGVAETAEGAVAEEAFDEITEFIESSIDAVAIGSGLSVSDEKTKRLVRRMVEERRTPIVIDADALTSLLPYAAKGSAELPLILTPHEGEFMKLLGTDKREDLEDRVRVARDFARKFELILVLKGERALIAGPDGRVVINPTGNSGLGKAGNGDTLAGIIVGFAAQAAQMKIDMFETIVASVYLAGLAGDIAARKFGKRSMLATDVKDCLTEAFREVEG